MTTICRYIDDPPSVFFWEIDEVMVFGVCFIVGILSNSLLIFFMIGAGCATILQRMKKSQSDGFFMHFLYWHGILKLKGCLPSYIRDFIE